MITKTIELTLSPWFHRSNNTNHYRVWKYGNVSFDHAAIVYIPSCLIPKRIVTTVFMPDRTSFALPEFHSIKEAMEAADKELAKIYHSKNNNQETI